jgi:hypothetical protein
LAGQAILLAPGDSVTLGAQVTRTFVTHVLGTYGPGTYYFLGRLRFYEPDFWLGWVAAGEVELQQ